MTPGAHTPGPWKAIVGRWEDAAEVVDANGFEVVEISYISINRDWLDANPDEHWGGHEESHTERPIEEMEGNAHLIAAAPRMLKALQTLVVENGHYGPCLAGQRGYGTCSSHCVVVRAAIAKATGGAS